ncbi:hypothetical protein SLEP1_g6859 [Rubroshorea leprosula]|uniref:Threonylcarbamoyl-AMP synthase n=1 Tax=Rubroshorea leprosula TaxID=152421 RepID=A0AAV5I2X2_9ROSI|nr:hypothetical protein SLEP1_g6859 [Rubroshorea leprosula]
MAEAVLCGEKSTQFLSFLRSLAAPQPGAAPCFGRVRFVTSKPAPLRVLAMSVKRSPKRLKYSAPRFTKEDSLLYVEADPSGAGNWKLEPYTFILTASKALPKQCIRYGTTTAKYASRKNVGVRIPDDPICQAILEKMDAPLICTSVKSPEENEWMIDPVVIADTYGPKGLDFVVDGGKRVADPSTVVDMTGANPKIVRQGKVRRLLLMIYCLSAFGCIT